MGAPELYATINLNELCFDEAERARAQELDALDCPELLKKEKELTGIQLSTERLSPDDQLTLDALSLVLLNKYVTKQLPVTPPIQLFKNKKATADGESRKLAS